MGLVWNIQVDVATYDLNYAGIAKTTLNYSVTLINECLLEQIDLSTFVYGTYLTRVLDPDLLAVEGPPLINHIRMLYPNTGCGVYEYKFVYPYNPLNIPTFIKNFDKQNGNFEVEPT